MSASKAISNTEQIMDTRAIISNRKKRREAEIEMTNLKHAPSVGFSGNDVKPKALAELNAEIVSFTCPDSSCVKQFGGCYLNNFLSTVDGSISMDNSAKLLQVFREKTRLKTKEEREQFSIQLFKTHCKNLSEVVQRTSADDEYLFGKSSSATSVEEGRGIIYVCKYYMYIIILVEYYNNLCNILL